MPWDCFCPKCSCCCVGGMTDDPDEMEKEIEEYKGKNIECLSCDCVFNFDTLEVIKVGKVYEVPEAVMAEILKLVNNLPYGQVAPLANALGQIIKDQQGEMDLQDQE